MQNCTNCHTDKPLKDYYEHKNKQKWDYCIECYKQEQEDRRDQERVAQGFVYESILKKQGLYEDYKRTLKYM